MRPPPMPQQRGPDAEGWRAFVFGHRLLLAGLVVVGVWSLFFFIDGTWHLRGGDSVLPAPAGRVEQPVTILYWTKWFSQQRYATPKSVTCPARRGADSAKGEKVQCVFAASHTMQDEAGAIVFHARDLELSKLPPRRSNQLWIYYSEENPLYDHRACGWYYRFKWWERQCDKVSLNPERMALFNLRLGYQLDSDIVAATYITTSMKKYTDQPMEPIAGKKNAVVWIANNCFSLNKREKYIKELMKWYPVDSYGDCLRNVHGKEGFVSEEEVLEIVKKYKFALAWENANCKDYVTEKLERIFQAGVLPIVDGPADYSPFVPNNHSVIRVADFAGPKALADYLRQLEQDDNRYLEYFQYKPPLSRYDPAFLAFGFDGQAECEICRRVIEELEGGQSFTRRLNVDNTCVRRLWDREYYADGTMSSQPTERWIEEWGFGGEDLVLWAAGIGLLLICVGLPLLIRRYRRNGRSRNKGMS